MSNVARQESRVWEYQLGSRKLAWIPESLHFKLFGTGWQQNYVKKPTFWSRLTVVDKMFIACVAGSMFGAFGALLLAAWVWG